MSRFLPADPNPQPSRLIPVESRSHAPAVHAVERVPLKEYLLTLRRHPWVVLLGVLLGLGIAGWVLWTAAPRYRATAVIRLIDERQTMTGSLDRQYGDGVMGIYTDRILSQLQILKSRGVAGEVVDALGLRLQPASGALSAAQLRDVWVPAEVRPDTLRLTFTSTGYQVRGRAGFTAATFGTAIELGELRFTIVSRPATDTATLVVAPRAQVVGSLIGGIQARPRESTDVVDVEYVAHEPALAQQIVNTFVETFKAQNADAAQRQSRRRRLFLQEQLRQTDSVLAEAQLALSAFRQREQVFNTSERFSAQQSALLNVDLRREELAADRRMLAGLLADVREPGRGETLRALVSSPAVSGNPVIAQIFGQLVQYETALDSLTTGAWAVASTHPDVQRLRSLIDSTRGRLVDAITSHIAALDARVAAMDDLRQRNVHQMSRLPAIEAEEVRLGQQVETLQGMADVVREELQRARIAEAVQAGQVEIVDLAPLPMLPMADGRTRKMLFGLLIGLFAGGGGALLLEHTNTSIRRREEIEELLRVPGLGVIPRLGRGSWARRPVRLPFSRVARINGNGRGHVGRELVTHHDGGSVGAEAYRMLRTNLLFSGVTESLRTVVVTSMSETEGKTITAANLATAFAQQGMRVLLVDGDLRRPRLHRLFAADRTPGLADVLIANSDTVEPVQDTDIERLFLLPAGTRPPNPSELLGGPRMRKLLDRLATAYDVVIIDTSPITAAADAAILGAQADGVVLVVRAGETERDAARQAVRQLTSVGARVVGAVLNDPDDKVRNYTSYYYYYSYGEKV